MGGYFVFGWWWVGYISFGGGLKREDSELKGKFGRICKDLKLDKRRLTGTLIRSTYDSNKSDKAAITYMVLCLRGNSAWFLQRRTIH